MPAHPIGTAATSEFSTNLSLQVSRARVRATWGRMMGGMLERHTHFQQLRAVGGAAARHPGWRCASLLICLLIACAGAAAQSAAPVAAPASPTDIPRLTARTLRVYTAPTAHQGVAADARHFYTVDNSALAKYDVASGRLMAEWKGPADIIRHMNSCLADRGRLWCANSNYPQTPMASSIETFDTATLEHVESHSLGVLDEGSLTWFDRWNGGWIAGFAHYDKNGGVGYKDHSFSSVVAFDKEWRRTGGWLFPQSAAGRMAPNAASGGAIGPDGWLYLFGHDRPEMYVVGRPAMGPALIHIATIDLEAEGQAFSWAQDGSRTIFAIDRAKGLVRRIQIPPVPAQQPRTLLRFR
jgi:hypothetical protein